MKEHLIDHLSSYKYNNGMIRLLFPLRKPYKENRNRHLSYNIPPVVELINN